MAHGPAGAGSLSGPRPLHPRRKLLLNSRRSETRALPREHSGRPARSAERATRILRARQSTRNEGGDHNYAITVGTALAGGPPYRSQLMGRE